MDDMKVQSLGKLASSLKSFKTDVSDNGPEGASFGDWLNQSIKSVNHMYNEADESALKLVSGENKDIHGTMIKMQKAEIAISLMMEIRNKVISAYEEIKRMQF
jgi:flagellar hook-basal body complex protein FliE